MRFQPGNAARAVSRSKNALESTEPDKLVSDDCSNERERIS
jgi:hypothetical protein